jgi:hypothetical protein
MCYLKLRAHEPSSWYFSRQASTERGRETNHLLVSLKGSSSRRRQDQTQVLEALAQKCEE